GATGQDLHLPLVKRVPGLVFDLGVGRPILGDGPVGGGAFRRLLENVLEVGHGTLLTALMAFRGRLARRFAVVTHDSCNAGPRPRVAEGRIGRGAPLCGGLDLGTNDCRLLIARPARDGVRVVDAFGRSVRLGESLSRTGRLDDRAMDRAYDALALCAERVVRKGVDPKRLTAVATQACRMAENGPAFVERVRRGTGLRLRIIDPSEEAALSVAGCLNLFDPRAEAVLVIDVGGGSTELSWLMKGARGIETVAWMSAPLGVVSLAERHPEPEGETSQWYEAMVAD